jgi:Tfp pilus assembly protein PilN
MAIKVNLLPREERPRRAAVSVGFRPSMAGANAVITGGTALFVLAAVLVGYLFWSNASEKDRLTRDIARLKEEDKQLKLKLTELELARAAKREIERRREIIAKVAKSQKIPLTMMNGLLGAVPQGIWLTDFQMKPQEVQVQVEAKRPAISYTSETLKALEEKKQEAGAARKPEAKTVTELRGYAVNVKGLAFNNFQVAEFMDNLKKAGFSDVDFVVTQATSVEQVRVMAFELTASVKL